MNPTPEAWKEHTSGRERVRTVVDTLNKPATVNSIAERADVAWETADSEIKRLKEANRVRKTDNEKYEPIPVQQFIDQILQMIDDHSRSELESQLEDYQEQLEDLEAEYGAKSAQQLRERLTDDNVPAEEIREIRNVSDTWNALEMEIRLLKNALQLYNDVSQLSESNGETPMTP